MLKFSAFSCIAEVEGIKIRNPAGAGPRFCLSDHTSPKGLADIVYVGR